jgi:hypothetical protein
MCWSRNADHLPLYRQSEIYAREGAGLDRSTMAGWAGGCSRLLEPLVEALRRHVMSAEKLHADNTPVTVLAPGNGKTKTGRLWRYVRDDRPWGDQIPPGCGSRSTRKTMCLHQSLLYLEKAVVKSVQYCTYVELQIAYL